MKIVYLAYSGTQFRFEHDGHQCINEIRPYEGLTAKPYVGELQKMRSATQADFAFCANFSAYADYLRSNGMFVFGGALQSWTLARNTEYRKDVMDVCKLSPLNGGEFCGFLWNGSQAFMPFKGFRWTHILDKDVGPNVGTVACRLKHDKDFKCSKELEMMLKKSSYRGMVCIDSDGLKLGFEPEYLYALLGLCKSDPAQVIWQIAAGQEVQADVFPDWAVSIRLALYPYPFIPPSGVPIGGISESALKRLWIEGAINKDGMWMTRGDSPLIAVETANGRTPERAFRTAYIWIKKLSLENLHYRTDLH